MGVYIEGMEMPTSGRILIVFPSGRALEVSADATQEIFRETKAVPVPPHGRLIDADALLNLLNSCMFPSDMVTTRAVSMGINWIKEAPTVIEAEDGEE